MLDARCDVDVIVLFTQLSKCVDNCDKTCDKTRLFLKIVLWDTIHRRITFVRMSTIWRDTALDLNNVGAFQKQGDSVRQTTHPAPNPTQRID